MFHDTMHARHMVGIHSLRLLGNRRDTLKAIKAIGIGARYDAEWDEYVLSWFGHDDEVCTYHTSDLEDAYNTARAIAGNVAGLISTLVTAK